jgi:FkbM family methyltransferase
MPDAKEFGKQLSALIKRYIDAGRITVVRTSKLRPALRRKIETYSEITGLSESNSIDILLKRQIAVLPNKVSDAYLLPDLDVAECDRVGDNLIRIKLKGGRVFFGQRSERKEYLLWNAFKNRFKNAVSADAYKLALDIQRRYFVDLASAYRTGGDYIEGGCYTGLKAIGWHDTIDAPHRIFAVEIGKSNYEILKMNIEANGLSDVIKPIHAGLWRESGEGTQRHAFTTRRFLEETDCWAGHLVHEEPTRLVSLDDLLEECGIDVAAYVNIQVNGAEIEVLKGLNKLDRVKVLQIAAYYGKGEERNVDTVRKMLMERGCKIINESEDGSITAAPGGCKKRNG